MIPASLQAIADWIVKEPIVFTEHFDDGRINSSFNENDLVSLLSKQFSGVSSPPPRYWYDFGYNDGSKFYPVNIKITETNSADNLNCKLGIFYALTGLDPDFANETNWNKFFQILKENLSDSPSTDYYFLVVNKYDTSDTWIASLKTIRTLVSNGNNLPFQCRWSENRVPIYRSHSDAVDFILRKFGDSVRKRAQIYIDWQSHFPEFT